MSTEPWKRDVITLLITLYKQNKCLYDVKCGDYFDRIKREDALSSICANIQRIRPGVNEDNIKTKIRTLRGQYTKEKILMNNSIKSGMSDDDIYKPKTWYFDQLQFLENYIKDRPGTSNISKRKETNLPMEDDSMEIEHSHLSPEEENYLEPIVSVKVDPKEKKLKVVNLVSEARDALQFAKNLTIVSPSKEQILGNFVTTEMQSFKDPLIYQTAKLDILTALLKAGQKQIEKDLHEGYSADNDSTNLYNLETVNSRLPTNVITNNSNIYDNLF